MAKQARQQEQYRETNEYEENLLKRLNEEMA